MTGPTSPPSAQGRCGAQVVFTHPIRFCPGALYYAWESTAQGQTMTCYRCDVCGGKQTVATVASAPTPESAS